MFPTSHKLSYALRAATKELFGTRCGEDIAQVTGDGHKMSGTLSGTVNGIEYRINIVCSRSGSKRELRKAVDAAIAAMNAEADTSEEHAYLRGLATELGTAVRNHL